MLFRTPPLTDHDLAVIRLIEMYRQQLRAFPSQPQRWKGQLRRNLRARAMRGSNSIEGYDVSLDDAIALVEGGEALDADQRTVAEVTGYTVSRDLRSMVTAGLLEARGPAAPISPSLQCCQDRLRSTDRGRTRPADDAVQDPTQPPSARSNPRRCKHGRPDGAVVGWFLTDAKPDRNGDRTSNAA